MRNGSSKRGIGKHCRAEGSELPDCAPKWLIDAVPTVGVLFFSLDGTIQAANATFERMSGYSEAELRSTAHWQSLTDPAFWDATEREAAEIAAKGEAAPYEKRMIRKDGSRWWGLFAPTRLSGSGADSQCIEFIIDITERKRAEEGLRQRERLQRVLAQAGELAARFEKVDDLVEAAGELVAKELGVSRCGFSDVDLDAGTVTVLDDYHGNLSSIAGVYPIDRFMEHWLREGLAGTPAIIDDVSTHPRTAALFQENFSPIGVRAHLTVPLHRGGKWVANFWASHHEARPWTQQDAEMMKLVAERVWSFVERTRAEEALREKGFELTEAQRLARIGSWLWEADSDRVTLSAEGLRIFGLDPSRQAVLSFQEQRERWFPAEEWERLKKAMHLAFQGGQSYHLDLRALRGGRPIWIAARGEVARGRRGQAIGIRGTVQDITERKNAEEALFRREAVLAQAGQMAHLGAWEIEIVDPEDFDANTLTWCSEVYRIFGYQPGALPVTNELFFERVHPDDRARVAAAVSDAIANRHPYSIEHRIVRPDGTERVVQEKAELVYDDRGTLIRLIGAVQDVTERKQIENALREEGRKKNEFMGMLSHELRNPLTPIRNSLYILGRAAPGGEQAQRAHRVIDRQTAHLARLVDDLLDVTRIARGKVKLQKERIELCELARRTIEDHRSLFAQNGIELSIEDTCKEAWILADPTRMAQVIGNLLQNAVKFTNRGGKTMVSISENRNTGSAVLKIKDTGQGIEPSLLARLFEPFVQADQALDRSKGGLGLGLSLVKGMVELHGGTVTAHSDGPGHGAEFSVSLPLDLPASEAPAARPIDVEAKLRVLVIEDNVDAAESLKEALTLGDHEVAVAFGGPEGLAKARDFKPHVILCDIGLPGMSGYEVARALRAEPALRQTRLIALTGYAAPEDQQQAKEAGFELHLSKPPVIAKIEEALARVQP